MYRSDNGGGRKRMNYRCPKCNENLEFKWSYCIDPDCCDWPHIISCIKCEFDVENYNAYDLVKEFLIVPSLDEA